MATLDKQGILDASDMKTEVVDVPEWNGAVIVRTLTGEEREEFEGHVRNVGKDVSDTFAVRAYLLIACLVDEKGVPLFTASDVGLLNDKSGAVLARLFGVAQRINRLGAYAIEAAAKN